jgi:multiple sugar transport system substrate-binding protein
MEPQVNNPGWVQGLQDWVDLKRFGPAEMANYGGGDMRGNFVAGDYALAIDWADVGVIAQDEASSTVKGDLGYFVLPGSRRVWNAASGAWDERDEASHAPYLGWGGWHGSVAARSSAPEAAWDFLNFIDSSDSAFAAVTTPGTARNPYRTPHFEDPERWKTAPVAYDDPEPYLSTQQESMNHPNAQFDLRIPKAGRYFQALDQWSQQALAGSLSPQEALDGAAEEWARITDEAGLDQQQALYRDLYGL